MDPAVSGLDGVRLLDMDDPSAFATWDEGRRLEVPKAAAIVEAEVDRYSDLAAERQVAPLVAALHERAEELRRAELARFGRRLGPLDESQARAVEARHGG